MAGGDVVRLREFSEFDHRGRLQPERKVGPTHFVLEKTEKYSVE